MFATQGCIQQHLNAVERVLDDDPMHERAQMAQAAIIRNKFLSTFINVFMACRLRTQLQSLPKIHIETLTSTPCKTGSQLNTS